jgi:hypothetical protein
MALGSGGTSSQSPGTVSLLALAQSLSLSKSPGGTQAAVALGVAQRLIQWFWMQ